MTPEEFVELVKRVVLEAAVDSSMSVVENPPGRRPSRKLLELNRWYQAMSLDERAQLRHAMALVAHHAVFGFLSVLDGARAMESDPSKGTFKLVFCKDGTEWELNPADGVPLHDLLNST